MVGMPTVAIHLGARIYAIHHNTGLWSLPVSSGSGAILVVPFDCVGITDAFHCCYVPEFGSKSFGHISCRQSMGDTEE